MKKSTSSLAFRVITTGAMTGGGFAINLLPASMSARLGSEADGFSFYRVKALKFRLHRSASTNPGGAAYIAGNPNTPPASILQGSEALTGVYLAAQYTVPSNWATCRRQELAGPLPWYKTVSGTDAVDFEYPGIIAVNGTSTDAFVIEIEGVYEFKDPIATANTPEEVALVRQLRAKRQEAARSAAREGVLRLLSPTANTK